MIRGGARGKGRRPREYKAPLASDFPLSFFFLFSRALLSSSLCVYAARMRYAKRGTPRHRGCRCMHSSRRCLVRRNGRSQCPSLYGCISNEFSFSHFFSCAKFNAMRCEGTAKIFFSFNGTLKESVKIAFQTRGEGRILLRGRETRGSTIVEKRV